MFELVGVMPQPWEVVVFSGLCAVGVFSVAGTIAATIVCLVTGIPGRAAHAAAAPKAQPAPAPVPTTGFATSGAA